MECKAIDQLMVWLEGRLPAAAAADVRAHFRACVPCKSSLHAITDDADLRGRLEVWRRLGAAKLDPQVVGRIIDQLASTLPESPASGPGACAVDGASGLAVADPASRNLGTFRLLNELGRGGMGIVYRAWDESLGRVVAVKVLRPERSEEVDRLRLVREAQLAARFRHEHAVDVYSVVHPEGGLPYMVMEFVEGPTLAELIASGNRPATRRAASLIAQVADAAEAAHVAGLIHRDVKPSNILIDARTDRAKITDFGLARATTVSNSLSRDGYLAGTPTYMSPEQARGEPHLDGRTDVYGLGATLYEVLTGATPYRGAPHLVLRQVIEGDPRAPTLLNDQVPRDLETICLKAMAREPARRYQTASALADDLRRWLRGESIHARPVGRAERAYRCCRRNPGVAGLAAALMVVFAAGFLGVFWQWRRAELHLQESHVSFARARRAVDQFYTRFYEQGVLSVPGMEKVRHDVLGEMLQYYQDFLARHHDDPSLRRELAETCLRIGLLTFQQGNKADALIVMRQACSDFERLLATSPDDRALQSRMVACFSEMAVMEIDQGDADAARRHSERAIGLVKGTSDKEPENQQLCLRLSGLYGNLANLSWRQNDRANARQSYLRALTLQRELARRHPANLDFASHLATTYHNLFYVTDSDVEKQTWCEHALALRSQIAEKVPGNAFVRHNLARTYQILGLAQLARGLKKDGLKSLHESHRILQQVVVDDPKATLYQDNLGSVCECLSSSLAQQGRVREAIAYLDQARTVYQKLLQSNPHEARYKEAVFSAENELALLAQKKER